MSTPLIVWHNGKLVSEHAAQNAATSASTLLGWGVFTTAGVWNGRAFALPQHLQRLRDGAKQSRVETVFSDGEIAIALDKVLRANRIGRGVARITLTKRGDGRWNHSDGSDLLILAQPFTPATTRLRVCLSPYFMEARRPLCGVKSTSHLEYQLAWMKAVDQGFGETILRNSQSFLCEAARSNLYWVKNGTLRTPSLESGCLPGVARQIILNGAHQMGIEVEEALFGVEELHTADEVFLSSATQGPRAVAEFLNSDQSFEYSQDAVTQRLIQFWTEQVEKETSTNN